MIVLQVSRDSFLAPTPALNSSGYNRWSNVPCQFNVPCHQVLHAGADSNACVGHGHLPAESKAGAVHFLTDHPII